MEKGECGVVVPRGHEDAAARRRRPVWSLGGSETFAFLLDQIVPGGRGQSGTDG